MGWRFRMGLWLLVSSLLLCLWLLLIGYCHFLLLLLHLLFLANFPINPSLLALEYTPEFNTVHS